MRINLTLQAVLALLTMLMAGACAPVAPGAVVTATVAAIATSAPTSTPSPEAMPTA